MPDSNRQGNKQDSKAALPVTLLVAIVIFVGSALLFVIQPFTARLFFPLAGGSPSLWNACMVFFQLLLLLGYTFTHSITNKLKLKHQVILVAILLVLPFIFLPITAPETGPPHDIDPTFWFLIALATTVGAPFLLLSTSSPLLQRWYSSTQIDRAKDPYFLYAASNSGSLVGLLGYPLFIEPLLDLNVQSAWFSRSYAVFAAGIIVSGAICYALRKPEVAQVTTDTQPEKPAIPITRYFHWILLAFIPSSLSLGVTHHLSTEIASIPLLWALPLSIYLITYILAFSQRFTVKTATMSKSLALITAMIAFAMLRHANEPILIVIGLHLALLFIAGLFCHKLLSDSRPDTGNLTLFYLMLAIGGSLGGIFNALVAPFLFNSILEYPLIIALACWMRIDGKTGLKGVKKLLSYAAPVLVLLWMLAVRHFLGDRDSYDMAQLLLRDTLPLVFALYFYAAPRTYAASILVILLMANFYPSAHGRIIHSQRTFFGVHRVTISPDERFVQLIHGTTIHGLQNRDPNKRMLSTSYFHPSGPVGQVFEAIHERATPIREVGILGLGAGSIAAFGREGERFTYFEIDPAVMEIALNPKLFTFMADSKAELRTVLGDGRKTLELEPDGMLDLLVMDAFSSDSAPVHLLTKEAFTLYLSKLKPDGILALNISNRYLTMESVVAANLNDLGMIVLHQEDELITDEQREEGKAVSFWIAAARNREALGSLATNPYWIKMAPDASAPRWTDQRVTLLDMLLQ